MNDIDRRLLENVAVGLYDLKESVDRLTASVDQLDRKLPERTHPDGLCTNCNHHRDAHMQIDEGDLCGMVGCGCTRFETGKGIHVENFDAFEP